MATPQLDLLLKGIGSLTEMVVTMKETIECQQKQINLLTTPAPEKLLSESESVTQIQVDSGTKRKLAAVIEIEESEDEQELSIPPAPKVYKQQNLFMAFMEPLLDPHGPLPIVRDMRINNHGADARKTYTNKDKFQALLFFNAYTGTRTAVQDYHTQTGIPVPTINSWLQTPESRAAVRLNFVNNPSGLRNAWIEKTLKPHLEERATLEGRRPSTLLFCDNLDSQVQAPFLERLRELAMSRNLLVAGETEALQAIDAGIGAVLKMLLGMIQDEWLDCPGNLDAWEGYVNAELKLTARMRRVLITHWVSKAWRILTTDPKYKDTLKSCFERTGALITADGTGDDKIRPIVGLPYSIPPTADLVEEGEDEAAPDEGEGQAAPEEQDDESLAEGDTPAVEDEPPVLDADGEPADEECEDDGGVDEDEGLEEGLEDVVDEAGQYLLAPEGDEAADDDALEAESYKSCIQEAMDLDVSRQVLTDAEKIPRRLVGNYALLLLEGEWEVVKVESSAPGAAGWYRYKVIVSCTYGLYSFSSDKHGRVPGESGRWVCLVDKK
eukprot:gene12576-14542_t